MGVLWKKNYPPVRGFYLEVHQDRSSELWGLGLWCPLKAALSDAASNLHGIPRP